MCSSASSYSTDTLCMPCSSWIQIDTRLGRGLITCTTRWNWPTKPCSCGRRYFGRVSTWLNSVTYTYSISSAPSTTRYSRTTSLSKRWSAGRTGIFVSMWRNPASHILVTSWRLCDSFVCFYYINHQPQKSVVFTYLYLLHELTLEKVKVCTITELYN